MLEGARIRSGDITNAKASSDTAHNNRYEMVEVTVRGSRELQCPEADVVEGFIVNAEGLVRVLDELVHRKGRVVRLSVID